MNQFRDNVRMTMEDRAAALLAEKARRDYATAQREEWVEAAYLLALFLLVGICLAGVGWMMWRALP